MPPFRSPALRYLLGLRPVPRWQAQRRWARVHDVRFLATHGVQERIIDRYRDKLDRKAKEYVLRHNGELRQHLLVELVFELIANENTRLREGHKGLSDLKEAYRERITNLRKQAVVSGATGTLKAVKESKHQPFHPPPAPAQPTSSQNVQRDEPASSAPPGVKTLSSFIDIPKTLGLPQKEIEYIWRLRHSSNPSSLCAVMPSATYTAMAKTARQHPQFILPLPRASEDPEGQKQTGAEIHFLQWTFPHPSTVNILFTHLAEYKLRGEYATPHTTVSLHLELAEPKGLVLVQGIVQENRGVTVDESKWLLMCLQKFYGMQGSSDRLRLLEQFTKGDDGFDVQQLLEEAEKI
jgi:ATP synthase F1 complex assembly factor 1